VRWSPSRPGSWRRRRGARPMRPFDAFIAAANIINDLSKTLLGCAGKIGHFERLTHVDARRRMPSPLPLGAPHTVGSARNGGSLPCPVNPKVHLRAVRDPTEQIGRQLDATDDPTLLVLRAPPPYRGAPARTCSPVCGRSPDELEPARLSFYQVLSLCRAIVGRSDEPAWAFMTRLNEVRNRMAHHLDPGDLDSTCRLSRCEAQDQVCRSGGHQ